MLDEVAEEREYPEAIQVDTGPEFISQVVDQWVYAHYMAWRRTSSSRASRSRMRSSKVLMGSSGTNA
jgi:hypothetical protein